MAGNQIFMNGRKEIEVNGFNSGNVSACILGKAKTHNGHTFKRIEVNYEK